MLLFWIFKWIYINNKYNAETLTAFKEAEDMRAHPEKYKSYNSVKEIFEDIMKEAADNRGFNERCAETGEDFAGIDYSEDNFERKEE